MKLFVISRNGKVNSECYRSLRQLCKENDIPYSTASCGRRAFIDDKENISVITEVSVVKMKKRGVSGFK